MTAVFRKDQSVYDFRFNGNKHEILANKIFSVDANPITINLGGMVFLKKCEFLITGADGIYVKEFTTTDIQIFATEPRIIKKKEVIANLYIFKPMKIEIIDPVIFNVKPIELPKNGEILFIKEFEQNLEMDKYKKYLKDDYERCSRADMGKLIWAELPYTMKKDYIKKFEELASKY